MEYLSHIVNLALLYVALTVSLNLILGYGGMASLSHAAFFCIGGYVSAIVTLQLSANFIVGVLLAVVITMVVGGVLAAPFIRVKEEYVLLFTLFFQMVVYHLMTSMDSVTGGDSGIFGVALPEILGWAPQSPAQLIPLMAAVLILVYWVAVKVTRSPFGRVLKGCREDDTAVSSLGKNVLRFKVTIFMVGTGIAAGVGALFAHSTQFINPSIGSLNASILIIAMVVLGGTANLVGSAVGATLLIIIPEVLNFIPGASDLIVPLRGAIYGILLLDEPSSGVDPNWVDHFMKMIRNLALSGKTICLVEHNLEVIRGVSDTVYFMAGGRKISQGSVEEMMADPELGEIYFGV